MLTRSKFLAGAAASVLLGATALSKDAEASHNWIPRNKPLVGGHFASEPDKSQQGTIDHYHSFEQAAGRKLDVLCDWFILAPYVTNKQHISEPGLLNYYYQDTFDTAQKLDSELFITWTFRAGADGNDGMETVMQGNQLYDGMGLNFDEWAIILSAKSREWWRATHKRLYFRFMHECNHVHSYYCPFNPDGSRKTWWPAHIRNLYKRFMEIAYWGGDVADLNRRLASIGQRKLFARPYKLAEHGFPRLLNHANVGTARVLTHQWGGVVPRLVRKGNEFQRYYPGPRYTAMHGIDIYRYDSRNPFFNDFVRFARDKKKPIALSETGLSPNLGDNPDEMRKIRGFIDRVPRIRFLGYFELDKRNAKTAIDAMDWRLHPSRPNSMRVVRNMLNKSSIF